MSEWQKIAAAIDGAVVMVSGIECVLHVRTDRLGEYTASMDAEPTERGRRTEHYRQSRRELGDDWSFSFDGGVDEDVWAQVAPRCEAAGVL